MTLKTGLEVSQGHWNWCYSKAWVWFPIRLPQQPWRYLVSFARYSDLLVENRAIFIPHLYLAPPYGVTPSEFREDLGIHKTRMKINEWAIVWWRNHDNTFSRFDTVPACDRQTDGRTNRRQKDVQPISYITCFSIADARKNDVGHSGSNSYVPQSYPLIVAKQNRWISSIAERHFLYYCTPVSYTHLTLPTIYSV